MAKSKKLQENGQEFFPITHEDCVMDDKGNTIGNKFKNHINNHLTREEFNTELAKKSNNHEHPYKPNNYIPSWNELTEKPTNVTTSNDGFMSKEDKTKLNSIANNANNYVHPNDANTRHVTDSEKNTWNAKETTIGSQDKATKALNDAKTFTTEELKKKSDLTHSHGQYLTSSDIIDNLTNTSNNKALSANQGKILSTQIATVDSSSVKSTRFNDTLVELEPNIINKLEKVENKVKEIDEVYENVEASYLNLSGTRNGYLENVEIKGNTVQNQSNLSDIKSVGKKLENQELYEIPILSYGKNILSIKEILSEAQKYGNMVYTQLEDGFKASNSTSNAQGYNPLKFTKKLVPNTTYTIQAKVRNIIGTNDKQSIHIKNSSDGYLTGTSIDNNNSVKVTFTVPNDGSVIFQFNSNSSNVATNVSVEFYNIQLEEGITATSYEQFKSNKLTILSPVQLEKVGDIADRIIEKNGAWGVEKNIVDGVLDGTQTWRSVDGSKDNTARISYDVKDKVIGKSIMSDKLVFTDNWANDIESICGFSTSYEAIVRLNKSRLSSITGSAFNSYLALNPINIKYATTNPQFIPLPQDQQILLKTFDNKTNISFLAEIEGTIKAQVPKSIKATVNTHTSQIENIYNELDRVNKLEESTVSTITTDKGSVNIKATTNGYFEDIKIYGKTLVNISPCKSIEFTKEGDANKYIFKEFVIPLAKKDTLYTIAVNVTSTPANNFTTLFSFINGGSMGTPKDYKLSTTGLHVFTMRTNNEEFPSGIKIRFASSNGGALGTYSCDNLMILEGDYTQNTPPYFQYIKSVGENSSDFTLSSVNDNLFDGILESGTYGITSGLPETYPCVRSKNMIPIPRCNQIRVKRFTNRNSDLIGVRFYDKSKNFIANSSTNNPSLDAVFNVPAGSYYMNIVDLLNDINMPILVTTNTNLNYTTFIPYKNDVRRILYFDTEDNTWKKPVLREFDTIEKHANGKYYYHKRSMQLTLNGSENWRYNTESSYFNLIDIATDIKLKSIMICDKYQQGVVTSNTYCINTGTAEKIQIKDISCTDVQAFKSKLQNNNVTVVYQLAQDEMYECTNLDLMTYKDETNFIINLGSISPIVALKVHSNISNVVNILQKKVSVLEQQFITQIITQNRMQLSTTYTADRTSFKFDCSTPTTNTLTVQNDPTKQEEATYNIDMYNLIKSNILAGKDNYDTNKIKEMITFYFMDFQISYEMYKELMDLVDPETSITNEV